MALRGRRPGRLFIIVSITVLLVGGASAFLLRDRLGRMVQDRLFRFGT